MATSTAACRERCLGSPLSLCIHVSISTGHWSWSCRSSTQASGSKLEKNMSRSPACCSITCKVLCRSAPLSSGVDGRWLWNLSSMSKRSALGAPCSASCKVVGSPPPEPEHVHGVASPPPCGSLKRRVSCCSTPSCVTRRPLANRRNSSRLSWRTARRQRRPSSAAVSRVSSCHSTGTSSAVTCTSNSAQVAPAWWPLCRACSVFSRTASSVVVLARRPR
mmetsp:Transcript_12612/g.23953  ORF Transcript_12612/g.23953 Transcript_12612/m.23953 type:complete len:220 (-) Transcript_12612:558-1217(-)